MKTKTFVLFLFIFVCLLSACSRKNETPAATTVMSPMMDTVLKVESIQLADLLVPNSYILVDQQNTVCTIYRILITDSASGESASIECYKAGNISVDFLNGNPITVVSAHCNSINPYDWYIFNNRFYTLIQSEKTIDQAEMVLRWDASSVRFLIDGNSRYFDLTGITCGTTDQAEGDDVGLLYLVNLLYDIRGTGTQYYGPTRN